ncbi:MAG: hypothetical protein ABIZ72_01575 [Candidatus Limnocylindrales bacterium]
MATRLFVAAPRLVAAVDERRPLAGPGAIGPVVAAPVVAAPVVAGPVVAGPVVAGPVARPRPGGTLPGSLSAIEATIRAFAPSVIWPVRPDAAEGRPRARPAAEPA